MTSKVHILFFKCLQIGNFDYGGPGYGIPGPAGPPGTCVCNMTRLLEGFMMPKMIQGPPGSPGINGQAGATGPPVSLFN